MHAATFVLLLGALGLVILTVVSTGRTESESTGNPADPAQVPALFDALVSVGKQDAVAALKEVAGVSA